MVCLSRLSSRVFIWTMKSWKLKYSNSLTMALSKQVGLSRARRLAQGQSIKIQLFAMFPVQIDGEPWFQQPCTINITHHGQVIILKLFRCELKAASAPLCYLLCSLISLHCIITGRICLCIFLKKMTSATEIHNFPISWEMIECC